MNKKGQALVEFLIVIPVFVMFVLAIFDYAKIMQTKFALETKLEDAILSDTSSGEDTILTTEFSDGEVKYIISKKVDIFSPFLSVFLGSKYEIKCERVVYE